MTRVLPLVLGILLTAMAGAAHASGIEQVRFVVVDPLTRLPVSAAEVVIEDTRGVLPAWRLQPGRFLPLTGKVFDVRSWREITAGLALHPTTITLPLGAAITLQAQAEPPVKDIFIQVRAQRLQPQKTAPTAGQTISRDKIKERSGADRRLSFTRR